MVKVSVVVPVYNAEEYLTECMDSIVNQTLSDIEIIIIDDGSTDNSAQILKSYLTDSRVSYYYKENEGLAAARRDGIARATGEYIGFVDSDDWLEPNMYERMYEEGKKCNADVVFCNCIQNENDYYFKPEMRSGHFNREQIKNEILPKTLAYVDKNGNKRAIRWCNWLRIYRREHLEQNNIVFDGRFRRSQDLQLTYEATLCANNYCYLGNDYLYHNRVVATSLSRGYTKNMWPLYRNLIDRLYSDTENFTELDLMPKMHLRAFFFATDCIENELKPLCPNTKEQSVALIKDIIEDERCRRFLGEIDLTVLNPMLKGYYKLIEQKNAEGFFAFTKRCKQREQNKIKFKRFLSSLTETKLYKLIRGK